MPLPATLTGLSWSDNLLNHHGPFYASSAWWAVLLDKTNNHVEVWKSTDGGNSWTEADSANHKSISSTSGYRCAGATLSGTTIHIAYIDTTAINTSATTTGQQGGRIAYVPFDTSAGTWGTVITQTQASSLAYTETTAGGVLLSPLVRTSGEVVIVHSFCNYNMSAIAAAAYSRIVSGAFVAAVMASATGTTAYATRGGAAGDGDRFHVFGHLISQADLYTWNYSSTNVRVQVIGDQTLNAGNMAVGRPFSRSTGGSFVVYVPTIDSTNELDLNRFTSADTPAAPTQTAVSATTTTNPETATAAMGINQDASGVLHVFWADATTDDLWYDKETSAGNHTFGTDTELADAATITSVGANPHGTQGIGVLYVDGGSVKFNGLNLPSGTPGAALAGTVSGTSAVTTPAITYGYAFTGTVSGVSAVTTPALSIGGFNLSGSVTGSASVTSPVLNNGYPLSGSTSGSSSVTSPNLSVGGWNLQGSAAGSTTTTSPPLSVGGYNLSGSVSGTSSVSTSALTHRYQLTGSVSGSSAVTTPQIIYRVPLAGTLSASSSVSTPSLSIGGWMLSGSVSGSSALSTPVLDVGAEGEDLSGSVAGTSSVTSPVLTYAFALQGSVTGSSLAEGGTLVYAWKLEGSTEGSSSASATLLVGGYELSGTVDGSSEVSTSTLTVGGYTADTEWRAETAASGASGTTPSVAKPTGLADGDILLLAMSVEGSSSPLANAPSGFTLIASNVTQANPRAYVWRKVITDAGSEPANYTWAGTLAGDWGLRANTFVGGDTTTPEATTPTYNQSATNVSGLTVSITPSGENDGLWSMVAANSSSQTITEQSAPWTNGVEHGGGAEAARRAQAAWRLAADGSIHSITWNFSGSATSQIAIMVALKAGVSGPPGEDLAGTVSGTSSVTTPDLSVGGYELTGTVAGTSAVTSPALSVGGYNLVGSVSASASLTTPNLRRAYAFVGSVSGTSSVTSPLLIHSIPLAGSVAASSAATNPTLVYHVPLTGSVSGTSAVTSPALTIGESGEGELVGTASGSATLTNPSLSVGGWNLTGSVSGSSAVAQASLHHGYRLVGDVSGTSAVTTPSLSHAWRLVGTVSGSSAVTMPTLVVGSLGGGQALEGTALGQSSVTSPSLSYTFQLSGLASGSSQISNPSLRYAYALQGVVDGYAVVGSADLTVGAIQSLGELFAEVSNFHTLYTSVSTLQALHAEVSNTHTLIGSFGTENTLLATVSNEPMLESD
jgi:hypothetical protein